MDNFQCDACQQTFHIPRYFIIYINNQSVYKTSSGQITCPCCNSTAVQSIPTGEVCSNVGRWSSASYDAKQHMLRQRAKQAMRRDEEQRHELDTHFHGRVNESHY